MVVSIQTAAILSSVACQGCSAVAGWAALNLATFLKRFSVTIKAHIKQNHAVRVGQTKIVDAYRWRLSLRSLTLKSAAPETSKHVDASASDWAR